MYTCQGCGYKTLNENTKSSYEICDLCGWEDDHVQNRDPDYKGGANYESLRERQADFIKEHPDKPDELFGYIKDTGWNVA